MRVIFLRFSLFVFFLFTASCAALDSFLAVPTLPPPTVTPTSTATPVWFPPTVTPSPVRELTREPTPDMRPNLGEIFLTDDFSDSSTWDTAVSDQASADIFNGRLNLAAQSGIYMLSLRRDTVLTDFYAELTARPSLCRGKDSFGLLIRANAVAYYRFALSCDGMVGAERVSRQSRETLQQPLLSGDAPLGAGEVRVGVWAQGKEARLFLNGRYLFSINAAAYPAGTLGVFVNAAGTTPVIVSFSDLTVRHLTNP